MDLSNMEIHCLEFLSDFSEVELDLGLLYLNW